MTRPVYVLRMRAEPGVDVIRSLRAWLKRGLRDFGLRCVDVQQEQERSDNMAINLNDAPAQGDRELIPDGVYKLRACLIPGGVGDDGMLTRSKEKPNDPSSGRLLMVKLECSVVGGEHESKKFWDYATAEVDEGTNGSLPPITTEQKNKLQTALRMGRMRLRAIIDSAFRLDPNDRGPEMEKKRTFESYNFFDGLEFWAQVIERPARGGYKASNGIDFVVVPGDPEYPEESKAVAPRSRYDDMDDTIPF